MKPKKGGTKFIRNKAQISFIRLGPGANIIKLFGVIYAQAKRLT